MEEERERYREKEGEGKIERELFFQKKSFYKMFFKIFNKTNANMH